MKTISNPKLAASLFRPDNTPHTVRVIKADNATQFASPEKSGHALDTPAHARKNAEVRMVGSGADDCDLEMVCGCGEVTRFRCWNTEEKAATK
jgi:hypothetical protein